MTTTNSDTSITEDFDDTFGSIESAYALNWKRLVSMFVAGTTEQQQLDIVASPLSSHALVEALAHSEHKSVLRAIVERGAEDNKVAAVAIVAKRRDGGEVSKDAAALVAEAMRERPASVMENLVWFIDRAAL